VKITLKMGRHYHEFDKALRQAPHKVADAIEDGKDEALLNAAGAVSVAVQHGDFGLQSRTGTLARSIHSYGDNENRFYGFVGVGRQQNVDSYAWQLTDQTKTITAQSGRFLSIPTAANKTGAGVARYTSPRQVPDGFFFKSKRGGLFFGVDKGGQVEALFSLVPSVTIHGSGALPDVMDRETPRIRNTVMRSISKMLRRLNLGR